MSDEPVIQGAPGEDQPATKPAFGEKVNVGGQEFVVDEKFAKLYQEQQEAFKTQLKAQEQQLQQLTASVSQIRQPVQPTQLEPPKDPYDELGEMIFSDPAAALRKMSNIQREEIKKESQSLRAGYQQDKAMDSFWVKFWKKHKDLHRDQDEQMAKIVGDVISKDISGLSEDQISDKVADGVREKLKGYMERFGGSAKPVPHVEGGGGQFAPKVPSEAPNVSSLGDALKQRREARRKASGRTGTGGT